MALIVLTDRSNWMWVCSEQSDDNAKQLALTEQRLNAVAISNVPSETTFESEGPAADESLIFGP